MKTKTILPTILVLSCVFIFISCNTIHNNSKKLSQLKGDPKIKASALSKRNLPPELLKKGQQLYSRNCSPCHGANAQGSPEWRKKNQSGEKLPPPLNSNGHAWHHSSRSLKNAIRKGNIKNGGSMPSFNKKLSESDLEALVIWINSLWTDEIYKSWKIKDNNDKIKRRNSMEK